MRKCLAALNCAIDAGPCRRAVCDAVPWQVTGLTHQHTWKESSVSDDKNKSSIVEWMKEFFIFYFIFAGHHVTRKGDLNFGSLTLAPAVIVASNGTFCFFFRFGCATPMEKKRKKKKKQNSPRHSRITHYALVWLFGRERTSVHFQFQK